MKKFFQLVLIVLLGSVFTVNCDFLDQDKSPELDITVGETVDLSFDFSTTGGFDDMENFGHAFGYAVDETSGYILIVSIRFNDFDTFYTGDFSPYYNPETTAANYSWGAVHPAVSNDIDSIPLLGYGATNTAGIHTMQGSLTAILLKGSLSSGTPDEIYIAASGEVSFTREDGPSDEIEGNLNFYQMSGLGQDATLEDGCTLLKVDYLRFTWDWDNSWMN